MPRGTLKSSFLLAGTLGAAQSAQPAPPAAIPHQLRRLEDGVAVTQAAQGYLEAWGRGDSEEMFRCLHPDLAASILELGADRGSALKALARIQGIHVALGPATQSEQLDWQIEVLGVRGHSASVRAQAGAWSAFLHLGAIQDRWTVVHVLWERQAGPAA